MTQEQIKKARAIRRRRVRERQAVVFGILAAGLGATALWGVGVYQGAIALPFDKGFTYQETLTDPVHETACLLPNTKPVGAKKIKVNIYNASEKPRLAASVATELGNRKIKVAATGNAETHRATTAIVFGPEGLDDAYTISAQFANSALILDDTKEDKVLDILLGDDFKSLNDKDSVELNADEAMNSRPGCVDIWELTDKVEPPEDLTDEEEPEEG